MSLLKKEKSFSVTSVIHNVRDRLQNFKHRIEDIKKEKERTLVEVPVPKKQTKTAAIVEVSPASVAKSTAVVLIVLVLLFFLVQISNIILIFFVSFLLAAAFDPPIDRLQNIGIPRAIGVLMVYIIFFVAIGFFITNVVSLVAPQVVDIAKNVGQFFTNITRENSAHLPFADQLKPYLDKLYTTLDLQTATSQLQNALQLVSNQLISISFGIANVVIVLILTFFMMVEEKAIEDFFLSLFPSRYAHYISTRLSAVKDQVGQWMRGQLLVSVLSTILSYIGLAIMGVNYALTLSIIAGIFMMVPVLGRFFAWIVAFPIVYNQSPILSLSMSIYYFILMQVENNIMVPYIMNKAVGLSPIIIIFAMMVGYQYLGILGWVLSIPLATTVAIFVKDYSAKEK